MECEEGLVEEALQAIKKAVLEYLRVNCRRILSMAGITGQRVVKAEPRGIFRYFEPTPHFQRFMQAYEYLEMCKGLEFIRGELRFRMEGEYIVFEIDVLKDFCKAIESEGQ